MAQCHICAKRIRDVKVVVKGIVYDVNVCASCLKPYMVTHPDEATRKIVKIIYQRITRKKKK